MCPHISAVRCTVCCTAPRSSFVACMQSYHSESAAVFCTIHIRTCCYKEQAKHGQEAM